MNFRYLLFALLLCSFCAQAQSSFEAYAADLFDEVRALAYRVAGDFPESIAFAKVAESHRPYSAIIEGGSEDTFVSARTAFQISYANHTIMLDSGMDEEVHRYYGFGRTEPYWPAVNDAVQDALLAADQIVFTHAHGDHIAGLVRSPDLASLAPKAILTTTQIETLIERPQLPQIAITEEVGNQFQAIEFDVLHAVAPGLVLISAPGHTAGHQMLYVRLENNREYLFIGDIGWSLDNITELKLRPEQTIARIGEDPQALMLQMQWINDRMSDGLIVVPSHDDILLNSYVEQGLISDTLRR